MDSTTARSTPRLRREPQALSALPDDLWHGLMTVATSVTVERKQVLFHACDEGSGCYVVRTGALKAVLVTPEGSERMIAVFDAGNIVGELALFDNLLPDTRSSYPSKLLSAYPSVSVCDNVVPVLVR